MAGLRANTGRVPGAIGRPEEVTRGQHGHSQTQLFPMSESLKPKNLTKIPMRAIKLKVPQQQPHDGKGSHAGKPSGPAPAQGAYGSKRPQSSDNSKAMRASAADEKKQSLAVAAKDAGMKMETQSTRSGVANIRRSRNEGTFKRDNDSFNLADNPMSAGQSTSSLYRQENVRKKITIAKPKVMQMTASSINAEKDRGASEDRQARD
jgi:hypothetical protein